MVGDVILGRAYLGWHFLGEHHFFEFGIAFFTLILAAVTLVIFRSGDLNTRRELRAYVGHEANGKGAFVAVRLRGMPDGTTQPFGAICYYEYNFGRTPADNIEMYVRIVPGSDTPTQLADTLSPDDRQIVIGYAPTGQNIGRIISRPDGTAIDAVPEFFLYGYVDYTDIFRHRWRHRFAFSRSMARLVNGGEEWVAVGEHHREEDLGPDPRAHGAQVEPRR